jgi:hypothetical protein
LAQQTGVLGEVKASIPGAIWATPPASLRHRVRGHLRLQHRQPKFASSVTRLGESAAVGHSPRGVFFDGTVLFPAELPAIDCRPTADMASRPRSSARLPCADGAPPYAAASILVNDCGASLPSTEIITRALIDPHGLEPVHGAASVDVRFGVHRAISSYVPILTRNLGGRTTKSSASMNKSRRALQVRRRIRHCAGSRFAKLRMCRP